MNKELAAGTDAVISHLASFDTKDFQAQHPELTEDEATRAAAFAATLTVSLRGALAGLAEAHSQ